MELKEFVRSKAHRTLKNMPSYRDLTMGVLPDSILDANISFASDERLIGIYQNSQTKIQRNVIITDVGIYLFLDGWRLIAYRDMQELKVIMGTPGNKSSAQGLMVKIKSGSEIEIPVVGGYDRFRDAWEFSRFLSRVVAKSNSENT